MKTMTMQEVFDKAVGGVLAQGQQSANADCCLYRGPGGLKCAVGHLIPDDYAACELNLSGALPADMKDESAHYIVRLLLKHGVPEEALQANGRPTSLLRQLQWAHDRHHDDETFPAVFAARARQVARERGLAWTHGEAA